MNHCLDEFALHLIVLEVVKGSVAEYIFMFEVVISFLDEVLQDTHVAFTSSQVANCSVIVVGCIQITTTLM